MRRLAVVPFLVLLAACSSGPSGPSNPAPPPTTTPPPPAEGPLSGRWVGLTSEGMGLITTDQSRNGDYCINRYDWAGTLRHQGNRVSGTMAFAFVNADCLSGRRRYHVTPEDLGPGAGDPGDTELTLTVTPSGGLAITWDEWVRTVGGAAGFLNADLAGGYTPDLISLRGDREERGSTWSATFGLRRP